MKGSREMRAAALAAIVCAGALALCAFARARTDDSRRSVAEAGRVRAEIQHGALADELAAEERYRAAEGALIAAAAARPAGAPPPRGASRAVRGSALRLAERVESISADSAEELVAALEEARGGAEAKFSSISIDALPGGRFRAAAAIRTFFLP